MTEQERPRDERELKAEIELRTPAWIPGGKLALSYRRLWDQRVAGLARKSAQFAETDEEDLYSRIASSDQIADLFRTAGERVLKDGDSVLQDALARLVAAALRDDAMILESSYLMNRLTNCDPIHIRLIYALPYRSSRLGSKDDDDAGPGSDLLDAEVDEDLCASIRDLSGPVRASLLLVASAVNELSGWGFSKSRDGGTDGMSPFTPDARVWRLTSLGRSLRRIVEDIHGEGADGH